MDRPCLAYPIFSRNSIFLSQQFGQNSVFQPVSAKILPAERAKRHKFCFQLYFFSACSLVGFSQPKPTSQQCFSLTKNQHQPAQTSTSPNQQTGYVSSYKHKNTSAQHSTRHGNAAVATMLISKEVRSLMDTTRIDIQLTG